MNWENTVLDLSGDEARNFFLQSKSYCNFDLPLYFDFTHLLSGLAQLKNIPKVIEYNNSGKITTYTSYLRNIEQDKVNLLFYMNKDGYFSWRPLQLINPVAYVYLVNIITTEKSWKQIKGRFRKFQQNDHVVCCSIPRVHNESPSKSDDVKGWYEWFEKEAIKKSLEYRCMVATDIANCYGSIYTHSIAWALHRKGKSGAKRDKDRPRIYNAVDKTIQDIQYSQTAGIPQGSVLMDFIAEMVLGYADLELSNRLNSERIDKDSYYILRYRDDYKIFTKNKLEAEKITKYLSEILSDLNLKLNEHKTLITEKIITDAQKSDKLFYRNIEISDSLDIRILQIHSLAEQYPNSGSIAKALIKFYEDLNDNNPISTDLELIASVVSDIAYRNPRTYPYTISILGRIGSLMSKAGSEELFKKIANKFQEVPNNNYFNIWLQRLAKNKTIKNFCEGDLCQCVKKYCLNSKKYNCYDIWKFNDYKDENIKNILENTPVIDIEKFDNMHEYPDTNEIKLFSRY